MSGEDDAEKEHEPSQKKLDDARRRGEVPRSTDLNTAAGYGAILLVAITLGGASLRSVGDLLASLLFAAGSPETMGAPVIGGLLLEIVTALAPWAFLPFVFVLLSIVTQRSFTVAPSKLMLKASRISILSNAKNKFGRTGLFEFAKSFAKLCIFSVALFMFLWSGLPGIVTLSVLDPGVAVARALSMTTRFMALVLTVALIIGLLDFLWQRFEHINRNRMSRKEMTDEHKDSDGDPHMKQQRRQRAMEIASNQMMADVPNASVVVVNPTHFAVALQWSRTSQTAPVCVAKGTDHVAARIRELATASGVPIHSDPPTARALHATVRVGEEIRQDHYAAVAIAIRFAEDMRKKAGAG